MIICAMSDIHGEREAFEASLEVVDLSRDNLLILCGDYIDGAHKHPEFLDYIKGFQEQHPNNVVVLTGNHEVAYLREVGYSGARDVDYAGELEGLGELELGGLGGLGSGGHEFAGLDGPDPSGLDPNGADANELDALLSFSDTDEPCPWSGETLAWVASLPRYYETDCQIFVHAGVAEEADDMWSSGTEDYLFYEKFPATFGSFYKDIIAGHVGMYGLCGENRVFWDGKAHYYIDGTTEISKFVPVLKYDTKTAAYSTFAKDELTGEWTEHPVQTK